MFPAVARRRDGEPAAVSGLREAAMRDTELLSEPVEAVSLARRRDRESQRQGRIFNMKLRTIGIDKNALDCQVRERREQEEREAETQGAYAADLLRSDRLGCLLEQRQRSEQRRLEGAIAHFRRDFQQPESRREFDLNDPAALRKQRGGLVLPGLAGEDPGSAERRRRQRQQMLDWALQQRRELEAARHQRRLDEQHYEDSRILLDRRAVELQNTEAQRRRAVAMATKDYNLAMAAESSERRRQARLLEEAANREEILNQLQGAPLSESLGFGDSQRRTQPSCYKGMSQEQLRQIREYQRQQVEDRQRARLEQQRRELEWDRRSQATARHGVLLERQQARLGRQLCLSLDRANAQLAGEQRAQKEHLEMEVFTNIPDDRYFAQFNTTSR